MIRDLRKSDAPELLRFLRDYFPEEQAILGFRPEGFYQVVARVFRWDLRFVLALLRLFGRQVFRFFVVEEGGHVVATTLVSFPQKAGYVSSVAVDPAFRRKGFAKALLEAARTSTAAAGRTYIVLDVLANNAPARALYESIGYRPLRENRIMVCEPGPAAPEPPAPGLRPFRRPDARALTEIARRAMPAEVTEVLPFHESYFRSGAVDRALASESARWVVDVGRGPEAYIEATRSPAMDAANVSPPIVSETADPGAVAAMVRTAVAWCSARHASRVVTQVPIANARGKAALEGGGFHEALSVFTLYRTVA
jgi:ribosomal protein S18 acetylase RimI-like enzyme